MGLSLMVAGGTYAFAQFSAFKQNISVDHEGETSTILTHNPDDKNSRLNPSLFTNAGDGRFNVVLVGIDAAASLTDSIQVISVDIFNKKISKTSVPRDFYYDGAKINSVYGAAERQRKGSGALAIREAVGDVLGIKVSNFALIDFKGTRDLIDVMGGIDVKVPKALYDDKFPAEVGVGYRTVSIPAGLQHMNGKTALDYSRSRQTTSDFDRSARQQLVMDAIVDKATSLGVIGNPVKITNIINTLGQHIKTDLAPEEVIALLNIIKDVPDESSSSHVLDTSAQLGLLTATTDPYAGYVEYPIGGYTKYEPIHRWFQKNNPDPLLVKETPTVTLINGGSASTKEMKTMLETLQDYGYTAVLSSTPAKKTYTKSQVFDSTKGKKPFSRNYLGSLAKATVQEGSTLSTGESDFELIYVPTAKK